MDSVAGIAEVAEILGVSRSQAHRLVKSPTFPEPVDRLARGPVWRRKDVEKWNRTARKRKPGPEPKSARG